MINLVNKDFIHSCQELFPGPELDDVDHISIGMYKGSKSIVSHAGNISIEKAKEICAILLQKRELGITFREDWIPQKNIYGICSGAALEFADKYLKIKKDVINKAPIPNLSYDKIAPFIIFKLKRLKGLLGNTLEMRTKQIAYSLIAEDPSTTSPDIDYSRNKFQSLANHHKLKIDFASPELNLGHVFELEEFEQYMHSLPQNSLFLVRICKYEENQKIDRYGHSMIYIQEGSYKILYDSNIGAQTLSIDAYCTVLFAHCREWLMAGANKLRFYRLS